MITEVLQPCQNGVAVCRAVYEGSFLEHLLCVTDRVFCMQGVRPEETTLHIEAASQACRDAAEDGRHMVSSLLPVTVKTHTVRENVQYLACFYVSEVDRYDGCLERTEPFTMSALRQIGSYLHRLHAAGIGHRLQQPSVIRISKKGAWCLPCPVLPFPPSTEANCETSPVEQDRRVFALMVFDTLHKVFDPAGDVRRLEQLSSYVDQVPEIKRYLEDTSMSCLALLRSLPETPQAEKRKKGQRSPIRVLAMLAVLIALIGAGVVIAIWVL